MGLANNLNKFEWENEIPFSQEQLKKTVHAMIGESIRIQGLLERDSSRLNWDLNCVNPENNDTFGSYGFGQINSQFSITIKKIDENSSGLKILVTERQGAFITGNQAYLQSECTKFIKALTYYLEHPDIVDNWFTNAKLKAEQIGSNGTGNGCMVTLIVLIGAGVGLLFML